MNVTHMNESWRTYKWITRHTWTHKWITQHICDTHMNSNKPGHTYQRVMSPTWGGDKEREKEREREREREREKANARKRESARERERERARERGRERKRKRKREKEKEREKKKERERARERESERGSVWMRIPDQRCNSSPKTSARRFCLKVMYTYTHNYTFQFFCSDFYRMRAHIVSLRYDVRETLTYIYADTHMYVHRFIYIHTYTPIESRNVSPKRFAYMFTYHI